jgi:hypothetical protein
LTPTLSVILPAMLGWETVRVALDAWQVQTCRSQLEVLVLCPDAEEASASLPAGCTAIPTGSLLLHEARALGIRRARAPYVLLAEDHCLPDPSYAGPILERIAEGWDAVGPTLRPGNRATTCAQASFLLGYGQWMEPLVGGPTDVLPGHNTVLRRAPLLDLGDRLEDDLLVSAFLLRRLREAGLRFFLEDRARMRHFDLSALGSTLPIFVTVGLGFGAVRTRSWRWPARILYPLLAGGVAARHWVRALTQYRRAGPQAGLPRSCLPMAGLLALFWAGGEALGALLGTGRAAPQVWRCEVKPLAPEDLQAGA